MEVFRVEIIERHLFRQDLTSKFKLVTAFSIALTAVAFAAENPMVGGGKMYATKDIIENAMNSKAHTTLVDAVKAAGLVDTLKGPGPFTVFAPTNEAFAKLPAGTVDTLLKPENKHMLVEILTYHVVSGKMTASDLGKAIKAGGGKASLKTVSGLILIAVMAGKKITPQDEKGGAATVTIANVMQSNGVIHVVDSVLQPTNPITTDLSSGGYEVSSDL